MTGWCCSSSHWDADECVSHSHKPVCDLMICPAYGNKLLERFEEEGEKVRHVTYLVHILRLSVRSPTAICLMTHHWDFGNCSIVSPLFSVKYFFAWHPSPTTPSPRRLVIRWRTRCCCSWPGTVYNIKTDVTVDIKMIGYVPRGNCTEHPVVDFR